MAIITISRGSYTRGKEAAERVARRLSYQCISREDLLEASDEFNIPEIRLIQARVLSLDHVIYRKTRYIDYFRAALLKHLQKDNVVYHGFAGHLFVRDIPRALKVQIIADLQDRARLVMERDKVSRSEALRFIKRIDEQRNNWSRHLYGVDLWDASLYDLVLNISRLSIDGAVDIICRSVVLRGFETTVESQRAMEELAGAAELQARKVSRNEASRIRSIANLMGV